MASLLKLKAIEKLQEYRSAVITAAVTGKIDVRVAVPSEPAEVKRLDLTEARL
jgi:hypothetical protein